MALTPDSDAVLETITTLAMDIARQCPDCAEPASRIAELAGQVRSAGIDRGAVQDALEAQIGDGDLSDVHVRATTESVVKAATKNV
jgi:hypothetical protein